MRALRPWTGWSRSRSAASRSPRLPRPAYWKGTADQHHRHPGPRGLHRRGRAFSLRVLDGSPSRSFARRAASSPRPRRSGDRPTNIMFPVWCMSTRWTSWVPTSYNVLKMMDERLKCIAVPIQLPIGTGRQLPRRHRPHQDERLSSSTMNWARICARRRFPRT